MTTIKLLKAGLIIHFIVNVVHGMAHAYFKIYPAAPHTVFAVAFFYILPGYYLYKSKKSDSIQLLSFLFVSLFIANAYALLYHFVIKSADFVCMFGCVANGAWFIYTAWLINIVLIVLLLLIVKRFFEMKKQKHLTT